MTNEAVKLNAWEVSADTVMAVQGEVNGRTLTVTIIDRSGELDSTSNAEVIDRPLDLTGKTVQLYVGKPDGKACLLDGSVKDAENGIAEFTLSQQSTAVKGKASLEVWITDAQENTLKIIGLTLDVKASGEADIESTNEFQTLLQATQEAKAAAEAANNAANTANEAAEDADVATQNANAAAGSANAEAVKASQAASDADEAVIRVNTAIQNAANATQAANTAADNAESKAEAAQTAADRANDAADKVDDALAGEIGPAIEEVIDGQKGKANGLASLGSTGTIPTSQIPTLPSTKLPTVPVSKGGTGKTSWLSSRMIYALSSTSLTQLAFPSVAGSILRQGRSGAPYWTPPEDMCDAIGAVPDTRTINSQPLSDDVALDADDIGALPRTGGQVDGSLRIVAPSLYPQISLQSNDDTETRLGVVEHNLTTKSVYLYNKALDGTTWSRIELFDEDTDLAGIVELIVQTSSGRGTYRLYGTHNVTVIDSTPTEFIGENVIAFCTSNHSIYRGIDGANVRFY